MALKITTKWKIICTVGFTEPVAYGDRENRMAHGGVTHHQVRRNEKGEILGRKVNSTGHGRHEIGPSFLLDVHTLADWERIGKCK